MAYTDDEKTYRHNVSELSLQADLAASDTTYCIAGELSVHGSFTATVTLQNKTFGDDTTAGEWVDAGVVTEPGSYTFKSQRRRPWRFVVSDYLSGSMDVYLEASSDVFGCR